MQHTEQILCTIDQLGAASVKQLHEILKIGTYRHTCRVIKKLENYLNVVRSNQKIVFLNKEGRQLIGSENEVKKSLLFEHMLLANDVYIYYDRPDDWKREYAIETAPNRKALLDIKVMGVAVAKNKIIPDAVFKRNGYVYLIEIDNVRKMFDNRKKFQRYIEMWGEIQEHFKLQPKLCVFTKSDKRKKEFALLCEKLPNEVWTFKEIM